MCVCKMVRVPLYHTYKHISVSFVLNCQQVTNYSYNHPFTVVVVMMQTVISQRKLIKKTKNIKQWLTKERMSLIQRSPVSIYIKRNIIFTYMLTYRSTYSV